MKFVLTREEMEYAVRRHFEIPSDVEIKIEIEDTPAPEKNDGAKEIRRCFVNNVHKYAFENEKIKGIKYIRTVLSCGLKEAKDFYESMSLQEMCINNNTFPGWHNKAITMEDVNIG